MVYVNKFGKMSFAQDEIDFLESLANLAVIAVDKALLFEEVREANKKLDKKIQELNTMFEISRELNSSLEEDKIAQVLSFAIMGELLINKCIIMIDSDNQFNMVVAKGANREIKELDFSAIKINIIEIFASVKTYIRLEDVNEKAVVI